MHPSLILVTTLLAGLPPQANAAALDELLAAHAAARGGAQAIAAVRGVSLDLSIVEPGMAIEGRYSANRDGCMRIDMFADGKHAISEGVARSAAWEARPGDRAKRPQPDAGAAALRHGIEAPTRMIGLNEFPARGHTLSYGGRVELDGKRYDLIRATYADGYEASLYLDADTRLIARMREVKAMHVGVDPTKLGIETRFSDYRPVAGVPFPFRSEEVDVATGKQLGVTTVRAIRVNDEASAVACELPKLPIG